MRGITLHRSGCLALALLHVVWLAPSASDARLAPRVQGKKFDIASNPSQVCAAADPAHRGGTVASTA